ncbi:MAG: nucleotidyl transferase AbiEii/AbiGii toxin family protein [Deltaproteobacteria bacterium]|nr:nucleotidyl transferase AbiEii/AbiGii toxin family protein [Deltaproteobacteria bacterium]
MWRRCFDTKCRRECAGSAEDESRAPGGLAYHLLVDQYVNERLLYRLARSPYGDKFVLKGAMMFGIWLRDVKRPTQDIDLLGSGEPAPEEFAQLLRDVLSAEVDDDGVSFDLTSIKVTVATRNRAYPGLSTDLNARFGKEQVRVHIDVGFGDTITPAPRRERYPSLLDLPAPELFVYPKRDEHGREVQHHPGAWPREQPDEGLLRSLVAQPAV